MRALLLLAALTGCAVAPERDHVEGTSLLGAPLVRVEPEGERRARLERDLAEAEARHAAHPSEENAIWVGRRMAYLGRYQEAIAWYTARLADHPSSSKLRRHRGHRRISVRDFAGAEQDLAEAWQLARRTPNALEPDGAPNRFGVPRSTDHGNVLYHLALAIHLQGRFEEAAEVWGAAEDAAWNDDSRAAARNWRWQALVRAGRAPEAAQAVADTRADWGVIENHAYLDLCLLYAGRLSVAGVLGEDRDTIQDATRRFGVAHWRACMGEPADAAAEYAAIVEAGPWNAFGVIAAEAELARARR